MYSSIREVITAVENNNIRLIDLKFTDYFGKWHHLTVPAARLDNRLLNDGLGFDGSNFKGMTSVETGDLSLVPDISTGFMDPFRSVSTLSFICDIVESDSKEPFSRDPRGIARKAAEYMKTTGIADLSMWGPEFEYYVFNEVFVDLSSTNTGYSIIPCEGENNGRFGLKSSGGYHAIPPQDTLTDIRDRTVTLLEEAGISIIYHHHEVGGHGQVEIEVNFAPLRRMGDIAMIVKYFARMVAHEAGMTATFMPKPLHNEAGSGMHFNQHLFKDGNPLFYNSKGYAGLSELAHHYIAGLLQHAPALLALTNPSTNSFKRLVPGFEAPVNSFFSIGNRSACIRIPKYANTPEQKRMEFRSPDATCNVYIAMAAQLMAGLDGIRRKLDPRKLGLGPFDMNIFALSKEERSHLKSLPESFSEALEALGKDHDFLLEGGVFDISMIEDWIRLNLQHDVMPIRNRTHPLEIQLYLDC